MLNDNEQTLVDAEMAAVEPASKPGADGTRAYLIMIAGSSLGEMYLMREGETTIGRSIECDIALSDPGISRRHAKLVLNADGQVTLCDLGSTNGTFVNGQAIQSQTLTDGDKIQVGSTTILKFSYQDTVEEQFQKGLFQSAVRDALTQAYNRRFLMNRLQADVSYSHRHDTPLSLLMIDLDHFKAINDRYGHLAGDHVLRHLSRTVSGILRGEDIFARYGGEEFAVVLRETTNEDAIRLAERIREMVRTTRFSHDGIPIPVTISMGVATMYRGKHATVDDLLKAADEALYAAKAGGRDRVEVGR